MYEVEWRINKRRKKQIIKQKNWIEEIFILGNKNEEKKKKSKKKNEDNVTTKKKRGEGKEREKRVEERGRREG